MKRHFCFEINENRELMFDFQFLVYSQLNNSFCNASKDFGYFKYLTLEKLKEQNNKIKNKTKTIPIGSVEFVVEWFKKLYNIEIKPINIPHQLFTPSFLKRRCALWSKVELTSLGYKEKKFIKSTERFKSICGLYDGQMIRSNVDLFTDEYYLVSDKVNIIAEYRVFVFKGKIQDIRRYSGDYDVFLSSNDIWEINQMIKALGDKAPVSYTLDVGLKMNQNLHQRDLFIIEMHDFFSVGLYGFESEKIPYMFSQWFYWKLRQEGIKL